MDFSVSGAFQNSLSIENTQESDASHPNNSFVCPREVSYFDPDVQKYMKDGWYSFKLGSVDVRFVTTLSDDIQMVFEKITPEIGRIYFRRALGLKLQKHLHNVHPNISFMRLMRTGANEVYYVPIYPNMDSFHWVDPLFIVEASDTFESFVNEIAYELLIDDQKVAEISKSGNIRCCYSAL